MILFLDLKVLNIQYRYKLIEGIKKISKYHDYYHLTPKSLTNSIHIMCLDNNFRRSVI